MSPLPPPAPSGPDDGAPPRPIGPERLRALREAILSGTYPLDVAVEGGLVSLFRGVASSAPSSPTWPGSASASHGSGGPKGS